MGYIHLFDTTSEFDTRRGDGYEGPWVSYTDQTEAVDYNLTYDEKRIRRPLTFQILSGGNIYWTASKAGCERTIEWRKYTFDWDTLTGTWTDWTEITSSTGGTAMAVNAEDIVEFRGNNTNYYVSGSTKGGSGFDPTTAATKQNSAAVFNVYGNIMSMCDKTGYSGMTTLPGECTFTGLFLRSKIIDAKYLGLPATTLTHACYDSMFGYNSLLREAPELPSMALAEDCYHGMFSGCTSLTTGPDLPAKTLLRNCYSNLFAGCSNLNYIKCMAESTGSTSEASSEDYLNNWVKGVQTNSGTFVKNKNTTWQVATSANVYRGYPQNWTVSDGEDTNLLSVAPGA